MTKEEAKILLQAIDELEVAYCTLEGISNDLLRLYLRNLVYGLQHSIFMHIPKEFIDYGTD